MTIQMHVKGTMFNVTPPELILLKQEIARVEQEMEKQKKAREHSDSVVVAN
jgi:hypothetical protein